MNNNLHPKLRAVEARTILQNGHPAISLRDPLQLSGNYVVLPQELGLALMLLDGTRDLGSIQALLLVRYGLPLSDDLLEYLITVLDDNFMLENERSAEAGARALEAYRRAPFRPPTLAGQSYPADPTELRHLFDILTADARGMGSGRSSIAKGRGVFSPHIDYPRGGAIYGSLWSQAADMAQDADLVVLLGTDHNSMGDRLTLTCQHYATPFGVLPTQQDIVDALAQAIGPEAAFAGELRNRSEHSLELVANWLHYARDGEPVELVPILTGSFSDFIMGQGEPAEDATLNAFLDVLARCVRGRRVLVVASGDLSHVGPAFGGMPLNGKGRARIRVDDDELMAHMAEGGADDFFAAIRRARDRNNVCGVSPFYLALRLLGDTEGQIVSYDQCPADEKGTSLVSVCGMVFG